MRMLDRPRRTIVSITALAIVSGFVYGRAFYFDLTHTDDVVLLVDDTAFVASAANIPRTATRPFFHAANHGEGYYRPLVTSSFIVDTQWRGMKAGVYHAANIAWHVAACAMFFVLLDVLGSSVGISFVAATLFCVSPAVAEAVYWIPGRCDLLLGVGFLISMVAFLRYVELGSRFALVLHLAGLAGALASKESGCVVPLVAASYAVFVAQRPKVLRAPVPWIAWTVFLAAWYIVMSNVTGARTAESASQRLSVAVSNAPALLVHLGKTIVPVGLSVLADLRDASTAVGWILLPLVVLGGVWLQGQARRLYVWGWLVFLFFLLPTLVVSDFLILENRLYVPMMGVAVAIAALAQGVRERWTSRPGWLLPAVAGAVVTTFAVCTWRYGESFRDAETFTAQAVATSPHLALAHLNRGIYLHQKGQIESAEKEYQTALGLDAGQVVVRNNLGLILMNRGQLAEAEGVLRQELAINPTYDRAHFNLGLVLARQNRLPEAMMSWKAALAINPENEDARSNLVRAESVAPGSAAAAEPQPGMTEVSTDAIPSETLVALFEQALQKEPGNDKIRRAYEELCRKRNLSCLRLHGDR